MAYWGDRTTLARAITLVESNAPSHIDRGQEVLAALLPHTGQSLRIGITGVPGAGKSTFIETFGLHLSREGHKVAVLAVDPSSSVTRGSILGDKTRMENLSRDPRCFIRPSPSGGALGGVARKTRESLLVCEAGGFDVVIVETIGVGQSEIAVRSMVDFFLLLLITGAGDELQGIKKGVIELADALVINKADSGNKQAAEAMKGEYARIIHHLHPATEGWTTPVRTCSALTTKGLPELWTLMQEFHAVTTKSGMFAARRKAQLLEWMNSMVDEQLRHLFLREHHVRKLLPLLERKVTEGGMTAVKAVQSLMEAYEQRKSEHPK